MLVKTTSRLSLASFHGIDGKTTVVENLAARAASADQTLVASGQCVEHHGAGEPYLPVLEALGRLARRPDGHQLVPLLARQAPTWLAQMPWLLADDELEALQRRLIGATHLRMLREMLETLEAISHELTVVLVLEDLHWSDPSTIDLLDALARRREPARLLVVGTYRPGSRRIIAVHRVARDLRARGLCTEIAVGPLSRNAVGDHLTARLGSAASSEVSAVLWERTGGNPLFVTTLLDSWLEQRLLDEGEPDLARLSSDVPDTVRQLIEQLLEQLDPVDRELLSAASAVGQEFSAAAAAAATALPEAEVEARCDALARAGRLIEPAGEERWPDGTLAARYRFAHDLHREVLYGLLPAGQRARTHGRIGKRLEAAYRTRPREIAATLAEHFVQAGEAGRAVASLRLAAEQAFERLAHREALAHLTTALELLEHLPEGPGRWSEELALQSMLGAAQIATRGWSATEAETAFLRARDLAERLDSSDELGWGLFRLGTLYEVRGDYERSDPLLEQALALSGATASNGLLTDSHELLACSLFHQGVFDHALEHAEQGLAAYDGQYFNPITAAYGDNAGAACHIWAALSLWFLGYPDRARKRAQEAVALADDPPRRHGYAAALAQAAIVEQCRLDFAATRATAQAAMEAAAQDGYRYRLAMAMILHGWALAAEGSHEQGTAELEQGLELSRETGARMDDPYYSALLADAYTRSGRVDAAWAAVEAGLGHAPTGRKFFFESELHRLAGELLLLLDRRDEAEARLREALDVARGQGSPSLELRAALSLAGHLRSEGQDERSPPADHRRLLHVHRGIRDARPRRGPRPAGTARVMTAEIPLRHGVLLRHVFRYRPRPRVLDEVAHLVCVDRGEADVDPVEPHVGLARQRELLRLRLDGRLAELLREPAAHRRAVRSEGELDDLADPELDEATHVRLVAPGQRACQRPDLVDCHRHVARFRLKHPTGSGVTRQAPLLRLQCQSGYSSFRQVRGSAGWGFGVRSSRKLKYGATNGSGADTV